jgi:hypothetical protein
VGGFKLTLTQTILLETRESEQMDLLCFSSCIFRILFHREHVRVQVMSFEAQSEDAGLGAVSESAIRE